MVRILIALLLCSPIIFQTACRKQPGGAPNEDVIVFAAASLTEAFNDLGERFEAAHPGSNLVFSFASSQTLAQQIAQGAPVDVFASANRASLDPVIEAGRINWGDVRAFAVNRLVVIYPAGNPASLHSLSDLAQPGLKLVLAAPAVPAGAYALDFLDKASQNPDYGSDYASRVLENVVSYEDNVKAVVSKVLLGEADAGIVYRSDVTTSTLERLGVIEIPTALNVWAEYLLAPVLDSHQPGLAPDFIAYVLSPEGQALLNKYGFDSPR